MVILAFLVVFAYAKSKDTSRTKDVGGRMTPAMEELLQDEPKGKALMMDEQGFANNIEADGARSAELKGELAEDTMIEKKERKNANLSLKVADIEVALDEIKQVANSNQGEVFGSYIENETRSSKRGSVTVKVPVGNFEKTITEIKKSAEQVFSEATTSDDVTAEFIDLEARLKNKQEEEKAFSQLLSKATNNQDLLDTTRELARVRGEIESLEGRKRYLSAQTDMSTIEVELTEVIQVVPVGDDWRPMEVVKGAFNGLVDNLQALVDWLIIFVIVDLPALILLGILCLIAFLVGRKIYRKIRK